MRLSTEIREQVRITTLYTAYTGEFPSGYYFKGECHDFWELAFVLDGCFGATNGSDVFKLSKGQAILHKPMKLHKLWVEGKNPAKLAMFTFSATNMPDIHAKIFDMENLELVENTYELICASFDMTDISITALKPEKNLLADISVKQLELLLLRTILCSTESSIREKTSHAKLFETVVKLLSANTDKALSVSDIAYLSKISEATLKKLFSEYAGMGVGHYFMLLKIRKAQTLLREGKTVYEVSELLGFANQNYFSTVFKRLTGHPPSFCKK